MVSLRPHTLHKAPKPIRASRRLLKLVKRALLTVVLAIAVLEAYQLVTESTFLTSALANVWFTDNLHEVKPGELFRAGQMGRVRLEQVITEKKLKTVIDLRFGEDAPDENGLTEADYVREAGASYVHFPIVGSEMPNKERLTELARTLKSVEPPLLIHCSSGTHRSGLTAALWLLLHGESIETAEKQLSSKFGFFRAERSFKSWTTGRKTIDYVLWSYADYHEKTGRDFEAYVSELPDTNP